MTNRFDTGTSGRRRNLWEIVKAAIGPLPSAILSPQSLDQSIPCGNPPRDLGHNLDLPINRLPPELLAEIFLAVSAKQHERQFHRETPWWVSCTHVCAHWREVALATPMLWNKTIFVSPGWVARSLERARSSMLRVEADLIISGPRYLILTDGVLSLLQPQAGQRDRLASIDLRFQVLEDSKSDNGRSRTLFELLTEPNAFLSLERLVVHDMHQAGGWTRNELDDSAPNIPFPNLRALSLNLGSHFVEYLPRLPALTSLSLRGYPPSSYDRDLWVWIFDALSSMSQLEEFTMDAFAPGPSAAQEYQSRIELPRLRKLEVRVSNPHDGAHFLSIFALPQLAELEIWIVGDVGGIKTLVEVVVGLVGSPSTMRMQPIGALDERVRPTRSPPSGSRRKRIHPRLDLSSTSVPDPEDGEYETSIYWESVLSDEQISALFRELADVRALRSIRALALANCGAITKTAWSAFMPPFGEVKTLSIAGFPPVGLFRALLDESQSAARPRFLRSIDWLMLHDVDFDADGYGGIPLLAGACFVDLVVRLVETRREACSEAGRLRVSLDSSRPIALGEIERLRCLVDEVRWDGWGCV